MLAACVQHCNSWEYFITYTFLSFAQRVDISAFDFRYEEQACQSTNIRLLHSLTHSLSNLSLIFLQPLALAAYPKCSTHKQSQLGQSFYYNNSSQYRSLLLFFFFSSSSVLRHSLTIKSRDRITKQLTFHSHPSPAAYILFHFTSFSLQLIWSSVAYLSYHFTLLPDSHLHSVRSQLCRWI